MWIGIYTELRDAIVSDGEAGSYERHVWICLIPTLPIHISWNVA